MIDLVNEQTFPLPQASKYLPRGRKGALVCFSTLLRWVLRGCKAPDGTVVYLAAIRVGGKWVTSSQALQRFAEALTPPVGGAKPVLRTANRRKTASERAAARLERAGI